MSTSVNEPTTIESRRIVFLGPHDSVGGAVPRIISELSAGLITFGWAVSSRRWGARSGSEGFVQKAVGRTRDAFRVSHEVVELAPDVVVIHTGMDWKTVSRDLLLCSRLRRHVSVIILQPHGGHAEWVGRSRFSPFRFLSRRLLRMVDGIFALSWDEAVQYAEAVPDTVVQRVANPFRGVTAPSESNSRGDQGLRLAFVGRLVETKGILDAIEAMAATRSAASLVVAGGGPLAEGARTLVIRLQLGDRVRFVGHLDQAGLADLYANSDVLVLPTYWAEGFPTVLAEAMAAGMAIVTTPVRGARDYLANGENCVFVPPRRPREIAGAIDLLDANPDLVRTMGERNQVEVLQFLPEPVVARYQEALLEVRRCVLEGVAR